MKTSRWTSPAYAISFSEHDCIFVDAVVDIIEKVGTPLPTEFDPEPNATTLYSAKVKECQLNPRESGFALSLARRLTTNEMTLLHDELCQRLLSDIQPSLHSLFYAGEIIPNEI